MTGNYQTYFDTTQMRLQLVLEDVKLFIPLTHGASEIAEIYFINDIKTLRDIVYIWANLTLNYRMMIKCWFHSNLTYIPCPKMYETPLYIATSRK